MPSQFSAEDLMAHQKTYAAEKQERFDAKIVAQLMTIACRSVSEYHVAWSEDDGSDVTMAGFMMTHATFPVKLMTAKFSKPVMVNDILKWPDKTPVVKALHEVEQNYPGEPVGLVFDSVNSGMSPMVIHVGDVVPLVAGHWRCQTSGKHMQYTLDPLKGFLAGIATIWRP